METLASSPVLETRNESFQKEALLNLDSTTVIWMTSLNNIVVQDAQTISLDEKTVLNSNLSALEAFVGIWPGNEMITNFDQLIGKVELTGTSGGQFAPKKITINAPGYSLLTDTFTVGLFLRGNDVQSLSASATVVAGMPLSYQSTQIFVLNATRRNISIQYRVPQFINPESRLDWIYLLNGDQPVMNNQNAITHTRVDSPEPAGVINMDISNIYLQPGDYIVQYNPGNYIDTVAGANSFNLL